MLGFVYVLENVSFAGMVKIGKSNDPKARALALSGGVPTPFEVVFQCETNKASAVEKMTHSILDRYRVASNREFFSCSRKDAIAAVRESVSNIHQYSNDIGKAWPLNQYIQENYKSKADFARNLSTENDTRVLPQQVTKWINAECIVVDGWLYHPTREV